MKEIIDELGKKFNEVAEQIGKKTEPLVNKTQEVVEIQKVKSQIRTLEHNNEFDLCDLGEIVFAKYKDGAVEDEDFVAICEEIEQRIEAIQELEKSIADLKGVEVCKECEMTLDKGVSYCSNCGAKVEKPVPEEPEFEEEDEVTIFDEDEPIFTEEDLTEEEVEIVFEEGDVVESLESDDAEIEIELVVEEISKEDK